MRIYTEVIFNWDNEQGKLVETSSESFDYHGELALCDWTDRQHYTDSSGNQWSWRSYTRSWGKGVDKVQYYKNGEYFSTNDNNQDDLRAANTEALRVLKLEANSLNPGSADAYFEHSDAPGDGEKAWKLWYKDTTNFDATEDLANNAEVALRATSVEWAWAGGDWQEVSTLAAEGSGYELIDDVWTKTTKIIDPTDKPKVQEVDWEKLSSETTRAATEVSLEGLIGQWQEIVTPGGFDAVESAVRGYISTLKEKETAVQTAYTDIFGEEGTIRDIEETWETAVTRGKEKYTTDIGTYGTEETEGLEETVVGREEELEALREEAVGETRAAEAKIGAAGFASTGVGQTARDILAEEIGKEARGIDVGFTEERSDVKRSYLEKAEPLEKQFGEEGTAFEDYITTRDLAAKGAIQPWKTATEAYEQEKKRYEEIYLPGITDPIAGMAAMELGDIGATMMELITSQQAGSELVDPDPTFDPFAAGALLGAYDPSQFGLMGETFFFTGVPETTFDEPFYEPYAGLDPTTKLYDPEETLPWED